MAAKIQNSYEKVLSAIHIFRCGVLLICRLTHFHRICIQNIDKKLRSKNEGAGLVWLVSFLFSPYTASTIKRLNTSPLQT